MKLTPERLAQLSEVNRLVNASIRPEPNLEGLAGEKWLLHPDFYWSTDDAGSPTAPALAASLYYDREVQMVERTRKDTLGAKCEHCRNRSENISALECQSGECKAR